MFDFFKKKPKPEPEIATDNSRGQNDALQASPILAPRALSEDAIKETIVEPAKLSFSERLKQGLSKTRSLLGGQLNSLFGGGKIDAETYEELEAILLTSDIGVAATQKLLDNLKKRVKRESLEDTLALKSALKSELLAHLKVR